MTVLRLMTNQFRGLLTNKHRAQRLSSLTPVVDELGARVVDDIHRRSDLCDQADRAPDVHSAGMSAKLARLFLHPAKASGDATFSARPKEWSELSRHHRKA